MSKKGIYIKYFNSNVKAPTTACNLKILGVVKMHRKSENGYCVQTPHTINT